MEEAAPAGPLSEEAFAELVDRLAADPVQSEQLIELLREDHSVYDQRGTATVVRMRGWVLLAIARTPVSDSALLFVLEELDTGVDAYLVAAAARALRSYPHPTAAFAPFVMRSLTNIRYRDEPVSFLAYGEYATSTTATSPVQELLATLAWLGPNARGIVDQLEALRREGGFAKKRLKDMDRAIRAIRGAEKQVEFNHKSCCDSLPTGLRSTLSWPFAARKRSEPIEQMVFEDQDGEEIAFKEFFQGHPTIVVFFYTRCDNPLKCSLTVTKLARIQKLLSDHGLSEKIYTAAITYDPAFDLPDRIRGYGRNRGVSMNPRHRMLRARDGVDALRKHFKLGVNFIESLVNRHRIEVFILDDEGRIAASFERIHWNEQEVVDRAAELLSETQVEQESAIAAPNVVRPKSRKPILPTIGTLASIAVAFFPKCPICWAAYMSVLGIAGLNQVPYSPWLQPVLAAVMLINLASVWFRARTTRRMSAFYLVSAGAVAIVVSKLGVGLEKVALLGVGLTFVGSLLSALSLRSERRTARV